MNNNKFYTRFLMAYGTQTEEARSKAVGWDTLEAQTIRYEVTAREIEKGTLLDVGCGFADFQAFLVKQNKGIFYTGIDIFSFFVAYCNSKGLNVRLENLYDIEGQYDYVTALGIFAIEGDMEKGIAKMLTLGKKIIVNGISEKWMPKIQKHLQVFDPIILQNKFGGRIIKDERLPHDFWLVIEKEVG